jgi:hypothetical protein
VVAVLEKLQALFDRMRNADVTVGSVAASVHKALCWSASAHTKGGTSLPAGGRDLMVKALKEAEGTLVSLIVDLGGVLNVVRAVIPEAEELPVKAAVGVVA